VTYIKGFKIRLYPTKAQEELMWKHMGCSRFIWNYMLDVQQERYKNGEKHLSRFDMIKLVTPLKQELEWLGEVSSNTLYRTCTNLSEAYSRFFKKTSGFPKYKSGHKSDSSFPIRSDAVYLKDSKLLNVEKLGKIRYKTDFDLPIGRGSLKARNAYIKNVNGKWLLSFSLDVESQDVELTDSVVGIDLGVKELAVVAQDEEITVFHNINKSKRVRDIEKRIRHLNRSLSRKREAYKKRNGKYGKTNNMLKEEAKLRKQYARLANIRNNYLHQTTHKIVSSNPKRIVMEGLNVTGMMKNRHLSKAIAEQCFHEFVRQMEYKCEWRGIELVKADRFYPSSKTCSGCGHIKQDLKLRDRTYVCEECGLVIDRDANAAINLQKYCA
jgi:putative transposase